MGDDLSVNLNYHSLFNCYLQVKHLSKIDPMISGVLDILHQNHHKQFNDESSENHIHLRMFLTNNMIEHFGSSVIDFMEQYFELIIQFFIYGNMDKVEQLADQLIKDMNEIPDESFFLLETMLESIYIFSIEYEDQFLSSKQKVFHMVNLVLGTTHFNMENETKFLQFMECVYTDTLQREMLRVILLNRSEKYEQAYEILKDLVDHEDFYKYIDEYAKTMICLNRNVELFEVLHPLVKAKVDTLNFVENNFGVIFCLYLSASLDNRLKELDDMNHYSVDAPSFQNVYTILKCHKKFQVSHSYGFLEQIKSRSSFVLLNSYTLSLYDSGNKFMQPNKEHSLIIHDDQLKVNVNGYSSIRFCYQTIFDFSELASNGSISASSKNTYQPLNLSLIYDHHKEPERELYSDDTTQIFASSDGIYICKLDDCWSRDMTLDQDGSEIICYRNYLLLKKTHKIVAISLKDGKETTIQTSNIRRLDVRHDSEHWIGFFFDVNNSLIALGQKCELCTLTSSLRRAHIVSFENIVNKIACYVVIENTLDGICNLCKYYIHVEDGTLFDRTVLFSNTDQGCDYEFYNEKEKIVGLSNSKYLECFNIKTGRKIDQIPGGNFYCLDTYQNMVLIESNTEKKIMVLALGENSVKVLVDLSLHNVVLGRFCGRYSFIIEKSDTIIYEYSLGGECLAIYPFKIGFTTVVEYFEHGPSQKRFIVVLEIDSIQLIELSEKRECIEKCGIHEI